MTREQVLDLMADAATEGLPLAQRAVLRRLAAEQPDLEPEDLELTAAALHLAYLPVVEAALPDHLATRVEAALRREVSIAGGADPRASEPTPGQTLSAMPRGRLPLLAAAALVLAVVWWTWGSRSDGARPEVLRADLLASATDVLRLDWAEGGDETALGATGDVIWSDEQQQGAMRFVGLAANDPGEFQYQLWVFDAERDAAYPVDGGVFDVAPGGGEVVVPITTTLPVSRATLFAVTVERPGGVVVSDRSRMALLASVP
jgi:anti-sigma-K factor RskA